MLPSSFALLTFTFFPTQAYTAFDQRSENENDDDWSINPRDVNIYLPKSLLFVVASFIFAAVAAVFVKYRSNADVGALSGYTAIPTHAPGL